MRLILHAGAHKTGTKSIQKCLLRNRAWLRRHGFFYPAGRAFAMRNHLRMMHGLVHLASDRFLETGLFLDRVRDEARRGETLLLSAENVYRHVDGYSDYAYAQLGDYWDRRARYLNRVSGALVGFDVEVLLFLRDRDDFVRSYTWNLNELGYWSGNEEDFRRDLAPLLDYDRQIALLERVFGAVRLVDYDAVRPHGGSIPAFFEAIGCPLPPDHTDVWENRSTPEAATPSQMPVSRMEST